MAAPQPTQRPAGRLLGAGLALVAAGGLVLGGCAQVSEKVDQAATGTGQAALAPAVNPVLDLLRKGESQVQAGNLSAAVSTMGGFQSLWSKAAPVIRPLAGDRWPAIEGAANTLVATFGGEQPTAENAQSAISGLIGPLSALVGQ